MTAVNPVNATTPNNPTNARCLKLIDDHLVLVKQEDFPITRLPDYPITRFPAPTSLPREASTRRPFREPPPMVCPGSTAEWPLFQADTATPSASRPGPRDR